MTPVTSAPTQSNPRCTPAPRQPPKAGCMWSCTRSSVDQASSLHRPPLHGTVHILPVCYPFRTAISFPIPRLTQRVHLLFLLRKATACTFGKTEGSSGSMFLVTYLRSRAPGIASRSFAGRTHLIARILYRQDVSQAGYKYLEDSGQPRVFLGLCRRGQSFSGYPKVGDQKAKLWWHAGTLLVDLRHASG